MRKTCVLAGIALAALGGVAPLAPAYADKADDTLRVAFAEEILNLDYLYTTKREYIILSDLIDEKLFSVDPQTNQYIPALATGYRYLDDTTIEVELREGVHFHDGSQMTAADVAYTYNFIIDDESESHATGRIAPWLDSVEIADDYTVIFHLKTVYPLAIHDMALRVPIRKDGSYHKDGGIDRGAMALAPIGLGPYRVENFEAGRDLVLTRFEDFYAESPKGDPAIGSIVVRTIPDVGTQQAELMSGGVDWMYYVPREIAEAMGAAPNIDHLSGPDSRIAFIVLDAGGYTDPDGPLTDLNVRQALNHAVNKAEIARFLIGGAAEPIDTPCHPAQFGCNQAVTHYDYDPDQARTLLAEAGYAEGFPLELWAYRDRAIAEAIAANFEDVGIDVELRYVQLESLNQARANRDIEAYIGTWTSDTAATTTVHFAADTDRNLTGDPEVSEMVLAADSAIDPQEGERLYATALDRITSQAYWVPLFTYSVNYLVDADLDFPLSPDGFPRLYAAEWK